MKNIKAISFDLWGTLIRSNPEFKKQRAELFAKYCDKTADDVNGIISAVKKDFDSSVEKFGLHFDSHHVFAMLFNRCGIQEKSMNSLYADCLDLFLKYPPTLIPGVHQMLIELAIADVKLYLSSNTVLVNGNVLADMLQGHHILSLFSGTFFSNELGISKPNPQFFATLQLMSGCLKSELLHVGDNAITDFQGATNYGINAYLLGTEENAIEIFYESFIKQTQNGNN